jgi:tripartite-type tricarboxylate transporter receptor subunit TctC
MNTGPLLSRRHLLRTAAAIAPVAMLGMPEMARAAVFPNRDITFIIPDSGGGTFGAYVREFCRALEQVFNPSVNVEPLTVPGAGGRAAAFQLLNGKPDGYTMGIVNVPGLFTSQYSAKNKPLDYSEMSWIANLGCDSYGLGVSQKSDIHNVADLQHLAKTRPIKFASTGFGSTDYFATRVFASATGLDFKQILGYTGSAPTMIAVARGDVDAVVHSLASLKKMEKAGLIRPIFVFQEKSSLPGVDDATSINIPDLGQIYQWRPIAAPPKLPAEQLQILSATFMQAASLPSVQAWARDIDADVHVLDFKGTLSMVHSQEALVARWKHVLNG